MCESEPVSKVYIPRLDRDFRLFELKLMKLLVEGGFKLLCSEPR